MCAMDRVLRYAAGTVTVGQTYCSYGLAPELYATISPTIAMQTRSRTQVSQYTTVVSQLHVKEAVHRSGLQHSGRVHQSKLRCTGYHVGSKIIG